MKAKLQKTTQKLTYSHIYKGPVLEKEWNGELNTPTLGGESTRLLEESKLIRRQLTQLQMQTNNLSCIHIQGLRSLILDE